MEVVTSTQNHSDYLDELSRGELHLVTYAEDGNSIFANALELAFYLDRADITKFCDHINQAGETGTLWPQAEVTAIPRKLCRESLARQNSLRRCIRDTFVANRDYCMSRRILFDFTCGVLNAVELEDEIHHFAMGEFNCLPLEEVEIRFDSDPGGF